MRKGCSKCGVIKNSSEFSKDRTHKDGLKSVCKDCLHKHYERNKKAISERDKEYYKENKGMICERNKRYYHRNKEAISTRRKPYVEKNRKAHNEYNKQYRKEHKERLNKKDRNYHIEHKEELNKYSRRYRKGNKEVLKRKRKQYLKTENGKAANRRGMNKRRAKRDNAIADLTVEQWRYILMKQKNRCNVCSVKFNKSKPPTQDHIIPVSQGGDYSSENIQALCRTCNSRKGGRFDYQYIQTWL